MTSLVGSQLRRGARDTRLDVGHRIERTAVVGLVRSYDRTFLFFPSFLYEILRCCYVKIRL